MVAHLRRETWHHKHWSRWEEPSFKETQHHRAQLTSSWGISPQEQRETPWVIAPEGKCALGTEGCRQLKDRPLTHSSLSGTWPQGACLLLAPSALPDPGDHGLARRLHSRTRTGVAFTQHFNGGGHLLLTDAFILLPLGGCLQPLPGQRAQIEVHEHIAQ